MPHSVFTFFAGIEAAVKSFYGMETSDWSVKTEVMSEASDRGLKVIYPRQLRPCEVANPSAKTTP